MKMTVLVTALGSVEVSEGVTDVWKALKKAKEERSKFIQLTQTDGSKCIVCTDTLGLVVNVQVPDPEEPKIVRPTFIPPKQRRDN
jgi:phosphoheptose isomerase